MARLAIIGNLNKGDELIAILEMLGGKNMSKFNGKNSLNAYFIEKNGRIWHERKEFLRDFIFFEVEEFKAKYPFKIGDCVSYNAYHGNNQPGEQVISKIKFIEWLANTNTMLYTMETGDKRYEGDFKYHYVDNKENVPAETKLKPTSCTTITFEYIVNSDGEVQLVIPDNIELEFQSGKLLLKDKKPKYPSNYEECCKVLGHKTLDEIRGYKSELLDAFQQLLVCRDAYWKVAGDWKPDVMYCDLYCIGYDGNIITWKMQGGCRLLAFPTEEMRDTFYKNFSELIEICKELI